MNSRHQDASHNNRLLFDPVSGKFQFIPTHLLFGAWLMDWIDATGHPLCLRAMKIPALRHDRDKVLWSYVHDKAQLEKDLAFYDDLFNRTKRAFWQDRSKPVINTMINALYSQSRSLYSQRFLGLRDKLERSHVFATIRLEGNPLIALQLGTASFASAALRACRVVLENAPGVQQIKQLELRQEAEDASPSSPGQAKVLGILARQGDSPIYEGTCDALVPSDLVLSDESSGPPWYFKRIFRNTKFLIVCPESLDLSPQVKDVQLDTVNGVTGGSAKVIFQWADMRPFGHPGKRVLPISGVPASPVISRRMDE